MWSESPEARCHPECRVPYWGAHIEGAEVSSSMDCEEAETLNKHDPKRFQLLESSRAWQQQAKRHRNEEIAMLEALYRNSTRA